MIDVGYTFVHGRSTEHARALLAAARRVGVDPARVKTVQDGYVIPNAVADELANAPDVETPPEPELAALLEAHLDELATFDPHKATYNELKAEAVRRFGPGAGAGTKDDLIARLSQPVTGEGE